MDTLPSIHNYGQSLPPRERSEHRAWVGLRVEALLEHFWQTRPSEAVRAVVLADWMDALEGFERGDIMAACRAWVADESRKPKPGDIRALAERNLARRLPRPKPKPEPVRERVSPEVAREIMERAGIAPKRVLP